MILGRRALLGLVSGSLACAMLPAPLRAQPGDDILRLVDPDLRRVASAMLQRGMPVTATSEPPPPPLPDGAVERRVPGLAGGPDVAFYLIGLTAPRGPARGLILHMHGGGFVGGSARNGLRWLSGLAARHDCVVASVEYRLAPRTRFPGAREDNYAVLKWLHDNAGTIGIDPMRIVLLGESAGGGHAASLAIIARDRGEVSPAGQVLLYPMLDDRTGSGRPVSPHAGRILWTPRQNRAGWQALLGHRPGAPRVAYGAVPARVENLRGLPPTFIGVGSLDLFVDEDIDFARRLVAAGVPTDLLVTAGAFHGSEMIVPTASSSRRLTEGLNEALHRALRSSPI